MYHVPCIFFGECIMYVSSLIACRGAAARRVSTIKSPIIPQKSPKSPIKTRRRSAANDTASFMAAGPQFAASPRLRFSKRALLQPSRSPRITQKSPKSPIKEPYDTPQKRDLLTLLRRSRPHALGCRREGVGCRVKAWVAVSMLQCCCGVYVAV
jgi:hypothetical protein